MRTEKTVIRPGLCIGCRSCELICAFSHTKTVNLSHSAITVCNPSGSDVVFPLLCMQCDNPECVKVCATKALSTDLETGVTSIDQSRCIRCKACIIACPFGNMRYDKASAHVFKCDLCGGNPACHKICPVGAIDMIHSAKYNVHAQPLAKQGRDILAKEDS